MDILTENFEEVEKINEDKCKEATLKIEQRANFSLDIIRELYRSTGGLCACPTCQRPTMARNPRNKKYTCIGEAAHIIGAKRTERSPRCDKYKESDFLKSFENGIWLCDTCHTIIDSDEQDYPTDKLLEWKNDAESYALESLRTTKKFSTVPDYSKLNIERMTAFQKLIVYYAMSKWEESFCIIIHDADINRKFENFLDSGEIDTTKLRVENLRECFSTAFLDKELEPFIRTFSKYKFSVRSKDYDSNICYRVKGEELFKVLTGKGVYDIPEEESMILFDEILNPLKVFFNAKL